MGLTYFLSLGARNWSLFGLTLLAAPVVTLLYPSEVDAKPLRGFLGGMEIELNGDDSLGAALDFMHLNLTSDQRTALLSKLRTGALNEYLTPDTLSFLPREVRIELTQGLEVGGEISVGHTSIMPPKDEAPAARPTSGLIQRATPPQDRAIIRVQPQRLPIEAGFTAQSGGLLLPSRSIVGTSRAEQSWKRVLERWEALSDERKRTLIDPDRLDRKVKANLFKAGHFLPKDLELRSDLPEVTRAILEKFTWHKDKLSLEFVHRHPVNDPQTLILDIERFADLVGIKRYINDPTKAEPLSRSFSLHYHLSRDGADLQEVAEELKKVRFLDLAMQGRAEAAADDFAINVSSRGLIRRVSAGRIEERTHVQGPALAIRDTTQLLFESEGDALKRLKKRSARRIAELEQVLSAEGSRASTQARSAMTALAHVAPQSPALRNPQNEKTALALLSNGNANTRQLISQYFNTPHFMQRHVFGLDQCETVECIHRKLSTFGEFVRGKNPEEVASLGDLLAQELKRDIPRWRGRLQDLNAGAVYHHLWLNRRSYGLPTGAFAESLLDNMSSMVTSPQESAWVAQARTEWSARPTLEQSLEALKKCRSMNCVQMSIASAREALPATVPTGHPDAVRIAQAIAADHHRWHTLNNHSPETIHKMRDAFSFLPKQVQASIVLDALDHEAVSTAPVFFDLLQQGLTMAGQPLSKEQQRSIAQSFATSGHDLDSAREALRYFNDPLAKMTIVKVPFNRGGPSSVIEEAARMIRSDRDLSWAGVDMIRAHLNHPRIPPAVLSTLVDLLPDLPELSPGDLIKLRARIVEAMDDSVFAPKHPKAMALIGETLSLDEVQALVREAGQDDRKLARVALFLKSSGRRDLMTSSFPSASLRQVLRCALRYSRVSQPKNTPNGPLIDKQKDSGSL